MSLIDSQDHMKTSHGETQEKTSGDSETQEDIQILFRVTEGRVWKIGWERERRECDQQGWRYCIESSMR